MSGPGPDAPDIPSPRSDATPPPSRPLAPQPGPTRPGRVALVVTTFNDARFLPDALASAFDQTRPSDEVIVIDDGSAEDPSAIVARFPQARLIRQAHEGISSARNTGLRATSAEFIAFLDANDALLPRALAAGLECMAAHPRAAFVYGAYLFANERLEPQGDMGWHRPCGDDAFATMLLGNVIGMHAAVLYRRAILESVGGFDRSLPMIEDYDVFLRVARAHPIASYPEVVALYRRHPDAMTTDAEGMLRGALAVQDAHRPGTGETARQRAWAEGRERFRTRYTRAGLRAVAADGLRAPSATLRGVRRSYDLWSRTRLPDRPLLADRLRFVGLLLGQFVSAAVEAALPEAARRQMRAVRARARAGLHGLTRAPDTRPVRIAPDSGHAARAIATDPRAAGPASPAAARAPRNATMTRGLPGPTHAGSVAVVVTTYNDARFLPDALDSIARQTRPPDEVVVVDDGSDGDPGDIVARFPGARLIRQENRGLSGARNTGLRATSAEFVAFLDADDALLPRALAAGLECIAAHPGAAFVYGAYRMADEVLGPVGQVIHTPAGDDPLATILLGNPIGMHATVLYRREPLAAIGGFDPTLLKVEDYDTYLRLARAHAAASHPEPVALYRMHATNMSGDVEAMFRATVAVHDAHRPDADTTRRRQAWTEGHEVFRSHYAKTGLEALAAKAIADRAPVTALRRIRRLYALWNRSRLAGRGSLGDRAMFARHLYSHFVRRIAVDLLPQGVRRGLRSLQARGARSAPGKADRP